MSLYYMIYSSPIIGKVSSNDTNLISRYLIQESVGEGGLTAKGMTDVPAVMEMVYILIKLVVGWGTHMSTPQTTQLQHVYFIIRKFLSQ